MIVIVDNRELVRDGFKAMFLRLGYPAVSIGEKELDDWLDSLIADDLDNVQAFLLGTVGDNEATVAAIREQTKAPLIAVLDQSSLPDILNLFENGADDVVKKPVHVTEILARAAAIRRRHKVEEPKRTFGALRVFSDGRDPQIDGEPFALPRRERRILEYLASIGDRRATRSQIYNAVYGVMEEEVDECVVESHISKLRKKFKNALGYDIIDSKRFLGYRLIQQSNDESVETTETTTSNYIPQSGVSLAQASAATVS
ncbi:MAG: winged helix-turn-helix domain-containing protein [Cyanobacteria bacterium P01_G01_bin.4]